MGLIYDFFLLFTIPLGIYYVGIPLLIYTAPYIMHHLFFLHLVRNPYTDYQNLTANGVRSIGRNFYLDVQPKLDTITDVGPARIGVWHILPATVSQEYSKNNRKLSDDEIEALLNEGSQSILIYFHGNSFDRTTEHRCNLYNFLSDMDFHTLVIDYRGYGDSQGLPSEDGLAADAHAIYDYAQQKAPNKNIYIWGHSMGTGVATRAVAEFSDAGRPPSALILESPFNNLRDVIRGHPLSYPLRFLPWFDELLIEPLLSSGLKMSSDERITRVSCPILVLHAHDDHIIPIELGQKLVAAAKKANRVVKMVEFDAKREFKHKFIHRAEELKDLIGDFLTEVQLNNRARNRPHVSS